jgi:hypothetical protein
MARKEAESVAKSGRRVDASAREARIQTPPVTGPEAELAEEGAPREEGEGERLQVQAEERKR